MPIDSTALRCAVLGILHDTWPEWAVYWAAAGADDVVGYCTGHRPTDKGFGVGIEEVAGLFEDHEVNVRGPSDKYGGSRRRQSNSPPRKNHRERCHALELVRSQGIWLHHRCISST